MKDDFFSATELRELGFATLGERVSISRHALFFGADRMTIGDDARIDAFAILSASEDGLVIGNFVHVAAFVTILGRARVELGDFTNLSVRVSVFSSNDDFSGLTLAGPRIPADMRGVTTAPVTIGRHVIVGSGSVVLPGVTVGDGAAVGALSLVKRDVAPLTIAAGVPARPVAMRSERHRELEERLWRAADERREPRRRQA